MEARVREPSKASVSLGRSVTEGPCDPESEVGMTESCEAQLVACFIVCRMRQVGSRDPTAPEPTLSGKAASHVSSGSGST